MASLRLAGLQAKSELNGLTIELLSYDSKCCRFGAKYAGAASPISVKPANILLVEDSTVETLRCRRFRIHAPEAIEPRSSPEPEFAMCLAFQADSMEWQIVLEDGQIACARSEALRGLAGEIVNDPITIGRRGSDPGKRLLAASHIQASQLIFKEKPAQRLPGECIGSVWCKKMTSWYKQFLQLPESQQKAILDLPVHKTLNLDTVHRLVHAFSPGTGKARHSQQGSAEIFKIFEKAGYPVPSTDRERFWKYIRIIDRHAQDAEEGSSLFLVLSNARHSCDPNSYACEAENGHFSLIALRDIQEGEEICISYLVDWRLLESTEARRQRLKSWGFTCNCARCHSGKEPTRVFTCIGGPDDCRGSLYLHSNEVVKKDPDALVCDVCKCRVDEDLIPRVVKKMTNADSGAAKAYLSLEENVGKMTSVGPLEAFLGGLKTNSMSDNHWVVARTHDMLADWYEQFGQSTESLEHQQAVLSFFNHNITRPSLRRGLLQDHMASVLFTLERRREAVDMYRAALAEIKACVPSDHKYLKETRQSLLVCLGGCQAPRQTAFESFRADVVNTYAELMDAQSRGDKVPERPSVNYDSEDVQRIVRHQTYLASLQKQERKQLVEKEAQRAQVKDKLRCYQEAQAICQESSAVRARAERVFRQGAGPGIQQALDELREKSDALDIYRDAYPNVVNVQAALWRTMSDGCMALDNVEDAFKFAEKAVETLQKLQTSADNSEALVFQLADAFTCHARALMRLDRKDQAVNSASVASQMAPVNLDDKLIMLIPHSPSDTTTAGRTCPACKAMVPKAKMKQHKKKCPRRIVECKDCESRFPWSLSEAHASECEARLIDCPLCRKQVAYWDMPQHERASCEFSNISCAASGCKWIGLRKDLAGHQQDCAFKLITCEFCLKEMEQHCMPGHVCPVAFGDDICIACNARFDELAEVSTEMMSRAPALLLAKGCRVCDHVTFCFGCAAVWQTQHATCPQCRTAYETMTPLPDFLLIAVEKKKAPLPKIPVPKLEDCPPYSTHMISPFDLHFTQHSVSERFRPFMHCGVKKDVSILDSVHELVIGKAPRDLECLDAVWHHDHMFVAGSGNRRLTMWRLLALLCPEHWSRMKVRFLPKDHHRVKFDRYFDTSCNGVWIEVRHNRFVGKRITQDDSWPASGDPGIIWDDVWSLFGAAMSPSKD